MSEMKNSTSTVIEQMNRNGSTYMPGFRLTFAASQGIDGTVIYLSARRFGHVETERLQLSYSDLIGPPSGMISALKRELAAAIKRVAWKFPPILRPASARPVPTDFGNYYSPEGHA